MAVKQDVRASSRIKMVHPVITIDELEPTAWTIDPRMDAEAHFPG